MRRNRPGTALACPERHDTPVSHVLGYRVVVWQHCCLMGRFGANRNLLLIASCAIGVELPRHTHGTGVAKW